MPSCVVKSCKNYISKLTRKTKSQGVTYHTFPRNKERRDDWISIIRKCRGQSDWNPSSASTVCSDHFNETDFKTTAKGLRCLVPNAIPKRLLSNSPGTQTQSTISVKLEISPIVEEIENDQQPTTSSSNTNTISPLSQVLIIKGELNVTGYCRLCATPISDFTFVNIDSDNVLKEVVVNMSNRLNTNIDFNQEHLPATVCSVCLKLLYTSYNFVVGIDKAQTTLNEIWMKKRNYQMQVNSNNNTRCTLHLPNTSLHQLPPKNEISSDIDPLLDTPSEPQYNVNIANTSLQQLSPNIEEAPHPHLGESCSNIPPPPNCQSNCLNCTLDKKALMIEKQRTNIRRLNQRIRRFRRRNESLKKILKKLKERNVISPDLDSTLNENTDSDSTADSNCKVLSRGGRETQKETRRSAEM